MEEVIVFMRSNKGAGGGAGRRIIREIHSSNGELFALRCRATGALIRLTDSNDELTYATATRSNTGYAHNCLAVNQHKATMRESLDKAMEKLTAKATKNNWVMSQYNEAREQLEEKFSESQVQLPSTYVVFNTVEEAQEAAG